MALARNPALIRSSAWLARVASSARTLARPRILRQGMAAAKRGNLEAAFALLREEVSERPDLPRSTLLFWELALACQRAPEAASPMARLVRIEATAGNFEAAADHWTSLVSQVPDAVVEVAVLMRIIPVLRRRLDAAQGDVEQAHARALLTGALQRSIDPQSGSLTAAFALRLVEEARGIDIEVARHAAQAALGSSNLHEAKRARLEELLRALKRGAWPEPAPAQPAAPERRAPPLSQTDVDAAAARLAERMAPAGGSRVSEVIPVELAEQALIALEGEDDRRTRIDYRAIEAIAVGEVAELDGAPVLVVDLLMRATRAGRPRSVLRMRSDAFDAAALFPDRTDVGQALRALLAELLDRSRALPLPDPDSALAVRPQRFETLAAFEAAVLGRLPI